MGKEPVGKVRLKGEGEEEAIFMQNPDELCKRATQCVFANHTVEDIVVRRWV